MKLLIDPSGGMAGDMFAAALVSAGADFERVRDAMLAAGEKLGHARIGINETQDGSSQLSITLESQRHHLAGREAREILTQLFQRFRIKEPYRQLGFNILDVLVKAEKQAHIEFNIVIEPDHLHSHSHSDSHSHSHSHGDDDAYLHEAQDIVMDIMGAVMGMQLLDIEPSAQLTGPVSVGGGHVHCSHGTLSIPAPATTVILREYGIQWQKGPIERELFTPTGAAILAALGREIYNPNDYTGLKKTAAGKSRGTKILDIPPFELYLYG
ncbi:MAG: LarC family nickel insertion protein [bacterium]|nr:LarC family nickel insertion protein [bacterium]